MLNDAGEVTLPLKPLLYYRPFSSESSVSTIIEVFAMSPTVTGQGHLDNLVKDTRVVMLGLLLLHKTEGSNTVSWQLHQLCFLIDPLVDFS